MFDSNHGLCAEVNEVHNYDSHLSPSWQDSKKPDQSFSFPPRIASVFVYPSYWIVWSYSQVRMVHAWVLPSIKLSLTTLEVIKWYARRFYQRSSSILLHSYPLSQPSLHVGLRILQTQAIRDEDLDTFPLSLRDLFAAALTESTTIDSAKQVSDLRDISLSDTMTLRTGEGLRWRLQNQPIFRETQNPQR